MNHLINGRYLLHESLGAGGMGVVYRTTDRLTNQIVALKSVTTPPQLLDFGARGSISDTDETRLALAHEFQVLASLRHPHIITVLDYGFDAQRQPYFTMDYLVGAATFREAGKDQPLETQVGLLIQLLQALTYLHRRDILHRDLKPGNVLVVNGRLKVLDFGLSANRKQEHTGTSGTLAYMAPEILQGQPASEATDLFAVGVLAYELFSGYLPFNNPFEILTRQPPPLPASLPEDVVAVVYWLLEKEPAYRLADAGTAVKEFCRAVGQPPPPETAEIRESFLQAATFVGREAELTQLTEALYDALDGNGSAWLIGGESGIGKSRLLNELRSRALVTGALVVRGQDTAEGGSPYQLWHNPVRRLTLASPPNYLNASILKEIVSDIGLLMGQHIPDAPAVDGKTAQQRLALTIAHQLSHLPQPLVLLLEDLQGTADSLEPLKHLIQVCEVLPLLIIASYHDDEYPLLPQELPRMQTMKLERLSKEAIMALTGSILGDAGRRSYFVEMLEQETEGNAFFLVETVRALAEEAGWLDHVAGTIPANLRVESVQQVMQKRLQRIPGESLPWLQIAAVIGRQLHLPVLQTITKQPSLENWLTICANSAVLEIQDGQWRFTHDKLREVILHHISVEERQRLHYWVAETIEILYSGLAEYFPVLTYHWGMAGETAKEKQYASQAGEQAIQTGRPLAALQFFQRALELSSPENQSEYAYVLHGVGRACQGVGNIREAEPLCLQSLTTYQALEDKPGMVTVYRTLGNLLNTVGRYDESRQCHQEMLSICQQLGDSSGTAYAYMGLGIAADYSGDYPTALHYYHDSLSLHQQLNDWIGMRQAWSNLGIVAYLQGQFAESIQYTEEALTIAQQIGHRTGTAYAYMTLGLSHLSLGHYEGATTNLQNSLEISQEVGDRLGMARALNNLSLIARRQGQPVESQTYLEQSLAICRDIGDRRGMALCHTNLGRLAHISQDYARATYHYQESMSLCEPIGEKMFALHSLVGLGAVYLDEELIPDAVQTLKQAIRQGEEIQAVPIILTAVATFGRLTARLGNRVQAVGWLAFVLHQPAADEEVKEEIRPFLHSLELSISPEDFLLGVSRGKALQLQTVLSEITTIT